ncbi:MAG TPA: hypothetical protein VLM79_00775 [Kofleriaceae bacterium]|nr:hypothetical protein [Kofleriaceae bacterium]
MSQPLDLSAAAFATFSRSRGSLVREVGRGESNGTFSAPVCVGAPTWDLEVTLTGVPNVAVGDARDPDLDSYLLGRLDGTLPTAETDVSLELSGLQPWTDGDSLQIVAGNNGAVVFSPELELAEPPAAGATSISGQSIDWAAQFPPASLVEAARGDVAIVTQLVAKTSGGESYLGLERAGTANGFTQTDGGGSTLAVAMSEVPQTALCVHWRGSAFEELRAESGAGAVDAPGQQGLFIDALPDAAKFGFYATAPDLVLYTPSSPSADLDLTARYGNPFATMGKPWDAFAIVQFSFVVPVQLGTAAPYNERVGYDANLALTALHGGVVAPLISPVRNVRIAGKDLSSPQIGVGPSPIVQWDAPRIGRATQYAVLLRKVTATATQTSATSVVRFVTRSRSLQIPGPYLAGGGTYLLSIAAINFGHVDRTRSLLGDGLPFESASSVTSTFTP